VRRTEPVMWFRGRQTADFGVGRSVVFCEAVGTVVGLLRIALRKDVGEVE